MPPYEEFESNFTSLEFTNNFTKQKKLIQYVLARLDKAETNGVAVDYDQMSIEHLASQSTKLDADTVGNIGNLLLCESDFNRNVLAAKPFAEKKAILKESKITLDHAIKGATSWGAEEINTRAKAMAKRAYTKVWKI